MGQVRPDADWLVPDWSAPGVGAFMTTRQGGLSATPFESLNLRAGIGDDPATVAANQRRVATAAGHTPVYLNQVHSARVVRLRVADAEPGAPMHVADASVTSEPGVVCVVQVADCLPVLFAAPEGRAVGAAHAGWRGLAAGVLRATLAQVCAAGACETADVAVWLGACIGPARFEVGADVLAAFDVSVTAESRRFIRASTAGRWLADLPGLARDQLQACGVRLLHGGHWCTVSESSRFFSYRRDGVTGRMAAVVWIERRVG